MRTQEKETAVWLGFRVPQGAFPPRRIESHIPEGETEVVVGNGEGAVTIAVLLSSKRPIGYGLILFTGKNHLPDIGEFTNRVEREGLLPRVRNAFRKLGIRGTPRVFVETYEL